MKSTFLKNITVHPDWQAFLAKETKAIILDIEKSISESDFTPQGEKVLRFLSFPLSSAKIIILGQDPYPQPGAATGRSFEVGTLKSWNEPFSNISLKNILRAVYKAYSGSIIKYNELKTKFDNEFPVLPPNQLFASWEGQGVLLLNTYFTCEIGTPGSHRKNWEDFSSRLFSYINSKFPDIYWFLWGAHAQEATKLIEIKNSVKIMHPMMCFNKKGRETDFLYGKVNCFELFKNSINWTGYRVENGFIPNKGLF